MTTNTDLEWFERFKNECEIAGFAVTCPDCMKIMRDIRSPSLTLLYDVNCFCQPPIDYDEVAAVHGLSLFKSMFHFTENTYVRVKLGLAR